MRLAELSSSLVEIVTDKDGRFERVSLRSSTLASMVADAKDSWVTPLLLYGPDPSADIDLLTNGRGADWAIIKNFRDLSVELRAGRRFEEIENRLDDRYYDALPHNARARLVELLSGRVPLDGLVDFVLKGPSGQGRFSQPFMGDDFLAEIERLCNTTGLLVSWQMRNSILPAFLLAIWTRRSRLRPLVLYATKRFAIPVAGGVEVPTSGISFSALLDEVANVYGLKQSEVEKAYRVWQLSRTDTVGGKEQATTPKAIAVDTARNFLGVLTRAQTEDGAIRRVPQKPAPLIFELNDGAIGLKSGVVASDPDAVIQSSAASLRRRVMRLQSDPQLGNVLPSASDILPVVAGVLDRVIDGCITDGDVVELGLELNALQWHVDAIRAQLSELSIGELTGLFATASLFLARFLTWLEYTGAQSPSGNPEDGVAAFSVAYDLLRSAHQKNQFLTAEASKRIDDVLNRTSKDESAPDLREGLVRSGENLAAVTASGLSEVVTREARDFGDKVKDKAYEEASSAIVSFAAKSAPLLFKLAELRHWPWVKWLHDLIPPAS